MTKVALTAVEAAYVQMVLEEHAARVQMSDARRDERLAVVFAAHDIPQGVTVQREVAPDGSTSFVFEAPGPRVAEVIE